MIINRKTANGLTVPSSLLGCWIASLAVSKRQILRAPE
jgi:hypothetical protein